MLLAHRLWEEFDSGATATLEHWRAAHIATLVELEPEFDAQWRGFDVSEQKTMRAIVAGDGSPYRGEVLNRLELTKDRVRRALPRLLATAEIESEGDGYRVVDPLLAEWIERLSGAPLI